MYPASASLTGALDMADTVWEWCLNHYDSPVYRQLRDRLEAGDLFCPDSGRFRSFEDDLVDDATLENLVTLLSQAGLAEATSSIKDQLAVLKDVLATARLLIFRHFDRRCRSLCQRWPEVRGHNPYRQRPAFGQVFWPQEGCRGLHATGQPCVAERTDYRRQRA